MISYPDYIKLLESKNLKFYDYHKRISYWRLSKFFNEQRGGGFKNIKNLYDLEPYTLEKVVLYSINKDFSIVKMFLEI